MCLIGVFGHGASTRWESRRFQVIEPFRTALTPSWEIQFNWFFLCSILAGIAHSHVPQLNHISTLTASPPGADKICNTWGNRPPVAGNHGALSILRSDTIGFECLEARVEQSSAQYGGFWLGDLNEYVGHLWFWRWRSWNCAVGIVNMKDRMAVVLELCNVPSGVRWSQHYILCHFVTGLIQHFIFYSFGFTCMNPHEHNTVCRGSFSLYTSLRVYSDSKRFTHTNTI